MNILISGYGRMGKEVEKIALNRNHKIIAVLDTDEDWEKIRNSIDLGRWKTIAFVKSREGKHFVFGMSKQRRKQLTMPYLGDLSNEELFEEILNMRHLIEKALGCDVRQYCFPEKIQPITHFF